MIRDLGIVQLISIGLGLLFGGWMLVVALQGYFWANQPVIRAFYDHDVLRDPHDEDGLFYAPALDGFVNLPLFQARRDLEVAGLSCEPVDRSKNTTSCTYGYETQTGCCRFRVSLSYDRQLVVTKARGDKTGRCPR